MLNITMILVKLFQYFKSVHEIFRRVSSVMAWAPVLDLRNFCCSGRR